MSITFNELPNAIQELLQKLNRIEDLLQQSGRDKGATDSEQIFTVPQAAEFLSLSVPTIYGLISRNEIPFLKRSKRCYFLKNDLINYLKGGRNATTQELAARVDKFLGNQKKK